MQGGGVPRPHRRSWSQIQELDMATFRPCRVCGGWFRPGRQVGNRQHVCSDPECQKEWHRKACAKWRKRTTDDLRAARIARQVLKERGAEQPAIDPLVAIDWQGVRKVVGLNVMVTVREVLKVLRRAARETSSEQHPSPKGITARVLPRGGRETSSEQPICNQEVRAKVVPPGPRDEMASGPGLP
jgi:hypothetical protein